MTPPSDNSYNDSNSYGDRDRPRDQDDRKPYGDRGSKGGKSYSKYGGDRDRKPYGKPDRYGDRDRKPYGQQGGQGNQGGQDGDRDRKPYGKPDRYGDQDRKPYGQQGGQGGQGGDRDRKPYGKPDRYGDRDRKPYGQQGGQDRYGDRDRKPYGQQGGQGGQGGYGGDRDRKPYGKPDRYDDRDRKPYGQQGGQDRYGDRDRKPYGQQGGQGGQGGYGGDRDRKPYGKPDRYDDRDRKPYGQQGGQGGDRDRKPYGKPGYGDRDRKPYGQQGGQGGDRDRKPYGKPGYGDRDRKPYGKQGGQGGDRKPYGKPGYGDRDRKPYSPQSGSQFGDRFEPSFEREVDVRPIHSEQSAEGHDTPGDLDLIYGRHTVLSAIDSERSLNKVWVVSQLRHTDKFHEKLNEAKANGATIDEVSYTWLDRMTDGATHQGVAAQVAPYDYEELDKLILKAKEASERPIILVADGITDPHNLGAIARTAEAMGAQGLVIPQRRAVGVTSTVMKVAAGALDNLPIARVVNLSRSLETLKEAGFWIYGLSEKADRQVNEVKFDTPTVLVLGSEGSGLNLLTQKNCDMLISVPLHGRTPSLNVSVATGMVVYEVCRQMRFDKLHITSENL
jgi:23S rRNA (guanosine2251-2'-O)-methyltransferase